MTARTRAIHAPWREKYLLAMAEAERGVPGDDGAIPAPKGSTGCFLRDYWLAPEQDEANHVVLRRSDDEAGGAGLGGMILLNLFPYASGHLLVALGESRARLLDYSPAQRSALWSMVDEAMDLLERAFEPQGVNVGLNQGRAAGAGLPQHAHVHLVPRWHGDVNFMSVVGDARVIPSSMSAVAARLRAARRGAAGGGG
ncbi:MAG: HIT domain-containing protein [Phycisphaerales bacterium]|nr:HIT domain-containing protein [Phycisphaerales bacterium]